MAGWPIFQDFDLLNIIMNEAAPFVAIFDEWGFMLIVSADLPYTKLCCLRLVHQNRAALAVLVVSKTTPSPLLRLEHQSTLHRILMHIAKFLRTLVVREHNKIVEAPLPNMAFF